MSAEYFLTASPSDIIKTILISLIVTLGVYCAFPLIFASCRKKPISRKKFRRICFAVNLIPWIFFTAIDGNGSAGPYLLWTTIFANIGVRKLGDRYLLDDSSATPKQAKSKNRTSNYAVNPSNNNVSGEDIRLMGKPFSNDPEVNDFFKSYAAEAADNIKANSSIHTSDSIDPEYGLVPNKPIYTAFIEGQKEYLGSLRTTAGESITWERKGSLAAVGINGMVDIYETYLPSGELYKTLYLNMYSNKTSTIPPEGFTLPNAMPKAEPAPVTSTPVTTINSSKQRFCKYCGGAIDPETKKCTSCGKQFFRAPKPSQKNKLLLIISCIIAVISIVLNVFQYRDSLALEEKTQSLQSTISQQDKTISKQENTISKLNETSKYYMQNYNKICSFLKSDDAGYASSNFNASEKIIVINSIWGDKDSAFELTANWYSGGTVYVSHSNRAVADISFEDDSWYRTTTMKITPKENGIDIITFSNDVNNETFRVMIIVDYDF